MYYIKKAKLDFDYALTGYVLAHSSLFVGLLLIFLYFPASVYLFSIAILILLLVETTFLGLSYDYLVYETLFKNIQSLDLMEIKDLEVIRCKICDQTNQKKRIYSVDFLLNNGDIKRFRTGCLDGSEVFKILKIIQMRSFSGQVDTDINLKLKYL